MICDMLPEQTIIPYRDVVYERPIMPLVPQIGYPVALWTVLEIGLKMKFHSFIFDIGAASSEEHFHCVSSCSFHAFLSSNFLLGAVHKPCNHFFQNFDPLPLSSI